jgi:hypothetical protein
MSLLRHMPCDIINQRNHTQIIKLLSMDWLNLVGDDKETKVTLHIKNVVKMWIWFINWKGGYKIVYIL